MIGLLLRGAKALVKSRVHVSETEGTTGYSMLTWGPKLRRKATTMIRKSFV